MRIALSNHFGGRSVSGLGAENWHFGAVSSNATYGSELSLTAPLAIVRYKVSTRRHVELIYTAIQWITRKGAEAMKFLTGVTLLVLLILILGCSQKLNIPVDEQAIKDANSAWDRAWNAGNCEALTSLYTVNAVAMGPNRPASVGIDAIRASCLKYFDQFRDDNRSVVKDVRVSGDLAVARGTQETKSTPKAGGNSVQDKSKWLSVYQRQPDGSWRILWEIYNGDLPTRDAHIGAQ
jgi:uncharacterized protein (TIGR02246 family)